MFQAARVSLAGLCRCTGGASHSNAIHGKDPMRKDDTYIRVLQIPAIGEADRIGPVSREIGSEAAIAIFPERYVPAELSPPFGKRGGAQPDNAPLDHIRRRAIGAVSARGRTAPKWGKQNAAVPTSGFSRVCPLPWYAQQRRPDLHSVAGVRPVDGGSRRVADRSRGRENTPLSPERTFS